MHRPAAILPVVSFVVLVLELALTRLYGYVGGAHATSTALSTALLGIALGAFARRWSSRGELAGPAALGLAAALFGVAAAAALGLPLPAQVALAVAPFALAGILISDAYAARGGARARSSYALDLAAAAVGGVAAPRLVGPLTPIEIVAALGLVCCAIALLLAGRRPRGVAMVTVVAAALVGLLAAGHAGRLPDGPLAVLLRSGVHGEKAMAGVATSPRDVIDSAWSPLGRLDVHRDPTRPDQPLGVFTDGMSPTYMVEHGQGRAVTFERSWGLLLSLPYRALRPARALVLGAGAGASVWLARAYGASMVDAVEVNPALPGLLARWAPFAGDVYRQPGVRLFVEDARRHLAASEQRYDLVELALALTGNAHAQPAGMEAYLYTVEAVELYLRRLTPTGALALVHSDPGNAFRQLRTVIEALERLGVPKARALDGIVVLRETRPDIAYRYLLVVRTTPLPLDVVDRLDVAPAELLWGPGDPPERGAQLLDASALGATAADDLTPVHDDRPYFFQNTRGLRATALAQPGRLWMLAAALVLVVVLAGAPGRSARVPVRPAAAAAGIGAAFLCVELALIQRFTLAAGGTLYAVSVVLVGVFAWSAVGALVLGGFWPRLVRGVSWASAAAGLTAVVTGLVVRDLAWLDAIASDAVRLAWVVALLAPVGLSLGGPFPALLAHHGEPARRIAGLWAINGAAAVAGGVVAVLALQVAGASHALYLAGGIYLATAAIAPAADLARGPR